MLAKKLRKSMPELLGEPALLAQTIYQALLFDSQVKDEGFGLSGTYETLGVGQVEDWEGIADVVLGRKEWFDAWLEGERRCEQITLSTVNLLFTFYQLRKLNTTTLFTLPMPGN